MSTITGKKPSTLNDVARVCNVSKTTVSHVLSGKRLVAPETRERVLKAIEELGFQANPVARELAGGVVSKTVAFYSVDIDLSLRTRQIQVMQSQLHTLGYSAPLYSYGYGGRWEIDNQLPLLRSLLASRPRAVICNLSGVMPELMEHLEEYRAGGGILVCYGYDEIAPIACDQVVFDVEHGFYLAARHLFQMGHRQLGAFDVGQRVFGGKALNGIMRAASESGADVRNEWLFGNTGEFRYEEEGILLAQKYLALKEKPSAMCIANDYAAVGFMCEVWKTGLRIPDDLSVVGHDDDAIAPCGIVPLTTVNYAVDAMAQHVIRFLRRRIEEEYQGPAECLTIRGTIVKRGSVTPPKTEKPALG